MSYPAEDITFGQADGLPGSEVLKDFNDRVELFEDTQEVYALTDYPTSVIRVESIGFTGEDAVEQYRQVAHQGVRQFTRLADLGIPVPSQRFITGPSVHPEDARFGIKQRLYAVTERLDGRILTNKPEDRNLSLPIIEKLASNLSDVLRRNGTVRQHLINIYYPRQFTVSNDQTTTLHDVGLELSPKSPSAVNRLFCNNIRLLEQWSNDAQMDHPAPLQRLIEQVVAIAPAVYARS